MKKTASLLEQSTDMVYYDGLFQKIKQSFRKKFLNTDGSPRQLTQTSAVLSVHFGLLEADEIQTVKSFLIKDITDKNYHLTTGFLGLSFLMPVLSSLDRNDIAWNVLTNNEFPSWFFMINNGATTLWERWDSFHPERGFYDPTMNSFNHCSLGCVGEWLITGIAGINGIEPGFRKIMIKPFIPDELTYAKASFKTNYGIINSDWEKHGAKLVMKIERPFNSTAVIIIPSQVYELSKTHSIIKKENSITYIEVGSGSYEITFNL
jgi:alpha-L-rhamnosidase